MAGCVLFAVHIGNRIAMIYLAIGIILS